MKNYIIFFCASHINSYERINYLLFMINSILEQKMKTPLYLSISYIKEVEPHIKILDYKYKNNKLIKIFIHEEKKSQFEHYNFLLQQIDNLFLNNTWCLFTDDDDYNHPNRSLEYYKILNSKIITKDIHYIFNQHTLKIDDLNINNFNLNKYQQKGSISCEYIVFCLKLSFLKKFCSILHIENKLNTHMCDVVLSSILLHTQNNGVNLCLEKWLYLYNNTENLKRSSHIYRCSYYFKTYSKELFEKLSKEFNCNYSCIPYGYSYVFNLDKYSKLQKKFLDNNKNIFKKIFRIN